MKVLSDDFKAPTPIQSLFIYICTPEFFTKDVLATSSLQIAPVLFIGHTAVHGPDNVTQLPVIQILLDLVNALGIVLVPG